MFTRLPDRMVSYATFELAELLADLTAQQRAAIDRIVEHIYLNNGAWADLFRGEDKICSESSYYRRGNWDAERERWKVKPGWGHNPKFQDALAEARRLALASQERERLHRLQKAKRRAEEKAESAVNQWVDIMEDSNNEFARIDAAGRVIGLAFDGAENDEAATGEESDWWSAALEDDE